MTGPAPELEIHIPISPTTVFLNRVHYFAASMQLYGGGLRDSPIVVTVGADEEPGDLGERVAWSRGYPIEWRWLDRELFREHGYFATRLRRFTYEFAAPAVLMLDCDVLALSAFEDLIADVLRTGCFHGTTAHVSPVRGEFTWERLFEDAGLGPVPYVCEHSGFGLTYDDPARRYCPPYFNLGVLAAPREVMAAIGRTAFAELDVVRRHERFFRAQMSVTLALQRHGLPWRVMGLRFNFPNDDAFATRHPEELADVRLLHYLRKHQFDKDVDFETPERIARLLERRDLSPVNAAFAERLRPVHARVLSDLGS